VTNIGEHDEMDERVEKFAMVRTPSPTRETRALPGFEFVSIRVDSWLGWHSIFNHI
jgi:hypothetical protein